MRIIGVDPGPKMSAMVELLDGKPLCSYQENDAIADMLSGWGPGAHVAFEAFRMYGVRSEESMMTILWTGRFIERIAHAAASYSLIYRDDVKKALCPGCKNVKDPDVRAAIIDRYGGKESAIGRKASPGPLFALRSHTWQALGVALTARMRMEAAVVA